MLNKFHLLYTTLSSEKFDAMRRIVSGTGIELVSPADAFLSVHVKNRSDDPAENARRRALAHYKKGGVPTLSVEAGLYLQAVPEKDQPGAKYRRVQGVHLRDEDCIDYYACLAHRLGGKTMGMLLCAACLVITEDMIFERCHADLSPKPFWLTPKAHPKRMPGCPLLSLAVNIDTGRYLVEDLEQILTPEIVEGYHNFFDEALEALREWQ